MIRHELGASGAIESQGKQVRVRQGSTEGFRGLTGEHGSRGFDGAGNDYGDTFPAFLPQLLDRDQCSLGVARVLAGFDQQQVHAAFE